MVCLIVCLFVVRRSTPCCYTFLSAQSSEKGGGKRCDLYTSRHFVIKPVPNPWQSWRLHVCLVFSDAVNWFPVYTRLSKTWHSWLIICSLSTCIALSDEISSQWLSSSEGIGLWNYLVWGHAASKPGAVSRSWIPQGEDLLLICWIHQIFYRI